MKGIKIGNLLLLSCFFILSCATLCIAQYPFEKYKAIKYKRVKFTLKYIHDSVTQIYTSNGFKINKLNDKYRIVIITNEEEKKAIIYIKKNGKVIQKFKDPGEFYDGNIIYPLYLGDINGDSLLDIKFSSRAWSHGGISAPRRVYLFQQANGSFRKISFSDIDFSDQDTIERYWPTERDINNDGNSEIIITRLIEYQHHLFWTYDLYNYINGDLVCVDDKYHYPLMSQYLYRRNYEITKRISPEKMRTFKKEKSHEYDSR